MEAKRKLNNPYGLKLDSANLLILGMEGLRPGRVVPVSQAAVEDAGAVSDADDQQRLGAALTCAVLYAIVVELVVKHIWEQKHAQIARYRHDVYRLFQDLEPKTQRDVLALYASAAARTRRPYKPANSSTVPDRSGRHGEFRGGLAVERTRHERPQVRHDPKWPKRARWHILEFQRERVLGFAEHLSELRHRTARWAARHSQSL